MPVLLSPAAGVAAQFFTNTGSVLTGGKIYTYTVSGTNLTFSQAPPINSVIEFNYY